MVASSGRDPYIPHAILQGMTHSLAHVFTDVLMHICTHARAHSHLRVSPRLNRFSHTLAPTVVTQIRICLNTLPMKTHRRPCIQDSSPEIPLVKSRIPAEPGRTSCVSLFLMPANKLAYEFACAPLATVKPAQNKSKAVASPKRKHRYFTRHAWRILYRSLDCTSQPQLRDYTYHSGAISASSVCNLTTKVPGDGEVPGP